VCGINFFAERKPLAVLILTGQPEFVMQLLQLFSAQISKTMSEDVFASAIQQ